MVLKFKDYLHEEARDEKQVALVMRAATAEIWTHDTNAPVPRANHVWHAGAVDMEMIPQAQLPDSDVVLTWRLWHMAITGVRGFTWAYPGLGFKFEIYFSKVVGTTKEEFYLGSGLLFALV